MEPLLCPDTIRVFGSTYQINFESAGGLGQDRIGSCDNYLKIITIDAHLGAFEEADTVLHEVLHAIIFMMKLDVLKEGEEQVVSTLATGLLGVFQDNPQLALWLAQNKSAHLDLEED